MINHLRTLLLNRGRNLLAAHEEFIPAEFRPVRLDFDTGAIHSLLLDPKWPREYRNYVATLLTGIAQDCPLYSVITDIDARTTLDFTGNQVSSLQDTISLARGTNASALQVVGTFSSDLPAGIFSGSWSLRKINSTTVEILDQRTAKATQTVVAFTGDSSPLYPLAAGNLLNFQFIGVSSVPDFTAAVQATNAPYYDALTALSRLKTSDSAQAVFGHPDPAGNLQKLFDIFENSRRPDQSLAAILIAYAYRLTALF